MDLLNQYPIIMAFAIFLARICDVSLGTVRTIVVFRGYRLIAGVIGFIEVTIWILAAGKVLGNLDQWYFVIAYSAGFASGNMLGIWLESKLAIGNVLITVVSENLHIHVCKVLRSYNYVVTEIEGKGRNSMAVEIGLIVQKRRNVPALLKLIEQTDPAAFYTVEDIRKTHNGIFNSNDEVKTSKSTNIWSWNKKK